MRMIRRTAALLMTMILLLSLFGGSALADGYSFKKLTTGKWLAARYSNADQTTVYTISLSKATMLTFSMKNNTDKEEVSFTITKSKPGTSPVVYFVSKKLNDKSSSFRCALPKGTFYLRVKSDAAKPKAKFKVSTANVDNKGNYSPATAIALKAGTKVTVAQLPMDDYMRWYRIKVSTKRALTVRVALDEYAGKDKPGDYIWSVRMFNRDLKYNYNNRGDKDSVTGVWKTPVVPAGTYYLCVVNQQFFSTSSAGKVITFWWK